MLAAMSSSEKPTGAAGAAQDPDRPPRPAAPRDAERATHPDGQPGTAPAVASSMAPADVPAGAKAGAEHEAPPEPACFDCDGASAVELIIEGRARGVGTVAVARILPSPRRRRLGPFVFLDHMGPARLPPGQGFDVPPHPHIGLSTVTYFLEGENLHRDSLGTVQVNRAEDLNLMTAGRGIAHSERATPELRERGGTMHGLQLWLALPEEHEQDAPSFEHHPRASLPEVAPAAGVRGRVLLGAGFGATSPVQHPSRPLLVALELEAGAELLLDGAAEEASERGLYVIAGEVFVGSEALATGRLAVLRVGEAARIRAVQATRLVVLGGAPMGPRFMDWNFVSSRQEAIDAARAAWKAQDAAAFPRIPGDDQEHVAYPELPRGARPGRG